MLRRKFKYYLHLNDESKIVGDTQLSFRDIKSMYKGNFEKSLRILLHRRLSNDELNNMKWYFVGDTDGHGIVIEPISRGTHSFFKERIVTDKYLRAIKDKYFK